MIINSSKNIDSTFLIDKSYARGHSILKIDRMCSLKVELQNWRTSKIVPVQIFENFLAPTMQFWTVFKSVQVS